MRKVIFLFISQVFVFSIFSGFANADNNSMVVPIFIESNANDVVEQEFLTSLRDLIQSSPRYREVLNSNQSVFQLKIVTLNPLDSNKQMVTIYSVVLTSFVPNNSLLNFYLSSWVGICPEGEIPSCSNKVFSAADGFMTPFLQGIAHFG